MHITCLLNCLNESCNTFPYNKQSLGEKLICVVLIKEIGPQVEMVSKAKVGSYLWRKYSDYLNNKWERFLLWNMIEPYKRPRSFKPLITIYVSAFYTGVIGAAITEQTYKKGGRN